MSGGIVRSPRHGSDIFGASETNRQTIFKQSDPDIGARAYTNRQTTNETEIGIQKQIKPM